MSRRPRAGRPARRADRRGGAAQEADELGPRSLARHFRSAPHALWWRELGLAVVMAAAAGGLWSVTGPTGGAGGVTAALDPRGARHPAAQSAGSASAPGSLSPITSDGASQLQRSRRKLPTPLESDVPRRPVVSKPKHNPHPTGHLRVVPGGGAVGGEGVVNRFMVEVEGGLNVAPDEFAAQVEDVLDDPRGWSASGTFAFERVDQGPVSFRVTLASRGLTDRLCAPLVTNGLYSCYMNGRAVLNVWRWKVGADAYGRDLQRYRRYLINHEVGHALGRGHRYCPAAGEPAPVMMQQTKGVAPCKSHAWPLAYERP